MARHTTECSLHHPGHVQIVASTYVLREIDTNTHS
jgi:hypothetical protein